MLQITDYWEEKTRYPIEDWTLIIEPISFIPDRFTLRYYWVAVGVILIFTVMGQKMGFVLSSEARFEIGTLYLLS